MKTKILFSLDGFLLHFCLSYYLKSQLDADFFGLIDINSKPKKFFEEQSLVKFQKNWFFHDHIKKTKREPDLDYLKKFERKYKIDLWKLALNERFFYIHNRFYKFQKNEILSILEQEIKLYESILDEVKPDYFLTYDPVFHHQKLLLDICRKKGINVLSVCSTRIKNKSILVENGATFDINSNIQIKNISKNKNILTDDSYSSIIQNYVTSRNVNFSKKLIALKDYLLFSNSENIHSNFMYYGKTKFSVIKDAMYLELKRKKNYKFLEKNSVLSPDLSPSYIYFPMAIDFVMPSLLSHRKDQ